MNDIGASLYNEAGLPPGSVLWPRSKARSQ